MCYEVVPGQAPSPCGPESAVERSPSPEHPFDLAGAVARVSDPYRKTFFDLAAEIRVEIYRNLFKGQVIMIRGKDFEIKGRRKEKVMRFERDRAIGLNIMLVNKACLVEAKAVALSVAIFDINFTSMLRQGCPKYLRMQEKFGRPELALLRTIEISELPYAVEGLVHQLSNMPFLHNVTWVVQKSADHFCRATCVPTDPSFQWDPFGAKLLSSGGRGESTREAIKQHVKLSAARIKKPARFVFRAQLVLWCEWDSVIVYGDFLDETVWVVDARDEARLFMSKRAEPRLFRPSQ